MIRITKTGKKWIDTSVKTKLLQITLRESKPKKMTIVDQMFDNTIFPPIYVEKSKIQEFIKDLDVVLNKYKLSTTCNKK